MSSNVIIDHHNSAHEDSNTSSSGVTTLDQEVNFSQNINLELSIGLPHQSQISFTTTNTDQKFKSQQQVTTFQFYGNNSNVSGVVCLCCNLGFDQKIKTCSCDNVLAKLPSSTTTENNIFRYYRS